MRVNERSDFGMTPKPGDRIEMHPATDFWMMGARHGTVVKVEKTFAKVKLDLIKKPRKVVFDNLRIIEGE